MAPSRLHTCMLCEAVCGISVQVEGGRVLGVRGDPDDPFSRGHLCPKAAAIPDVLYDPDRVRAPMRRAGDRWEPVAWAAAIGEAAARLAEIRRRHGRDAVALYLGNPTVHGHGAFFAASFLARTLGGRSRFSATSVDQLPQMLAALEMFGHQLLLPVPDVDRTDFLLVLGANPLASNGSLMTAPGIAARLAALRRRGGRLVVVDPRRSETAAAADQHLAIRPAGDAALLLGLLHVLFAEGLSRPGRLAAFTDGLERLAAIATRFPPERVAARAGLAAEEIRGLARAFAAAPSAACYARVGACTQEFGALASWLAVALNVVTGNLDRPGGAMFTAPALDLVALGARSGNRGSFGRFLRSNNSWMHNARRLVKGPAGCRLLVSPADAAARGLEDGDEAVVRSRVAEVRIPVAVSEEVPAGVVSLPHGFGHHREGVALQVAQVHAGASLNDLTDDQRVDPACGTAAFSGTPVTVERAS